MSSASDFQVAGSSLCGCCAGLTPETPMRIENRPGLSAIAYRVGTHARFKHSLLAGLSDSDPERDPLGKLQTRANDDFSIALLDSFAVMTDVLTFYQERIANEQYLRTATERLSVQELARLIGYRLASGVAADTWLAFTLDDAKGAPGAVTLTPGVKVQSLPGPGETPQTFETIETLDARTEWNALRARATRTMIPQFGDKKLAFAGVTTGLKVGDWILLIGTEREGSATSDRWDLRQLQSINADLEHNITLVSWSKGLGYSSGNRTVLPAAAAGMKAYALRTRTSLFGYNAPDVRLMSNDVRANYTGITAQATEWPSFTISAISNSVDTVHLDGNVPQVVPGSWIVLAHPTTNGDYIELYKVLTATADSRHMFGLAGKTTRLKLEGENLTTFDTRVRETIVHGQSEQLAIAEPPDLDTVPATAGADVIADRVVLDRVIDDPGVSRAIILRGPRAHVVVTGVATTLFAVDNDGHQQSFTFDSGSVLELLEPPKTAAAWATIRASSLTTPPVPDVNVSAPSRLYHVRNVLGKEGYVITNPANFAYAAPPADAPIVSELVTLKLADAVAGKYTRLLFDAPLTRIYDRASLVIFANVAKATHGEATAEVLGAGNGGEFQTFALKQAPLTYTRSLSAESGASSTLEVTVNDLVWKEVDTFFGRGQRERVFITRGDDSGKTTIEFGDGQTGARVPTGRENVKATYRKGIGRLGLVKAEQLSLLLVRPLGVRGVTNPLPAMNAEDPEVLADARANAPPTVLTLGRVVSLRDYEDFARSYVGVAKAVANRTFDHNARGVYVTVAGIDGGDVADKSDLQTTLIRKLQLAGDGRTPIRLHGYRRAYFRLSARIKVDVAGGYQQDLVFADVRSALATTFAFAVRAFGQAVSLSEVVAVMQNVAGVVAVDVRQLYRSDSSPEADPESMLVAQTPGDDENASAVHPAELLLLDPVHEPILDVMP